MKNLHEEINLGGIKIRNRFVRSATHEGFSPNGEVTEKLLNLYETLARNEVGLIISSGIEITDDIVFDNSLRLSHDKYIEPMTKLTETVHREDGKILAQLLYGGSFVFTKPNFQPLGPSAIKDRVTEIVPKEMTGEDIKELIHSYAQAAKRSKEAGFDGVQIQASAGFLLNKYLSPHYNRRTDAYGGSVINRSRIIVEIRKAIVDVCGSDYPVFVKLSIDDLMKEDVTGLTFTEGKEIAKILADAGYDCIEACGGIFGERPLTAAYNDGKPYFEKEFVELAKELKVPLIAIGGIRKKEDAVRLINNPNIEAVAFSRPFIADDNLVQLYKVDQETKCVTCFQCSGPEGIRCVQN